MANLAPGKIDAQARRNGECQQKQKGQGRGGHGSKRFRAGAFAL
jgi:hypothetical protein